MSIEPGFPTVPERSEGARLAGPGASWLQGRLLGLAAILLVAVASLLALAIVGRGPEWRASVAPAAPTARAPLASSAQRPAPHASAPIAAPAAVDSSQAPARPTAPGATTLRPEQPASGPSPTGSGFAVLLLGYGGGGHDGALLTDAMMVAIADPDRKTVALLSLPRDIWAPALFDGRQPVYGKLNTVYAYAMDPHLYPQRLARYQGQRGAGTLARDTVARLLGIPIDSYLALDFAGFRALIDAVGGIDVVVPATFAAQYPRDDDPQIDPGWKVVRFTAGPEHMNGERALQFTRARLVIDGSGEGNDFARAHRQRLVLTALKNWLLQPAGAVHLPEVLAIARQHSDTDYPLPAAGDLARLAVAWGDVRIHQATLSPGNYLREATGPDDAYVVVPRAPDASWATIRAFARRLWADPALGQAMSETTVVVVNRTGELGLAGRVCDRLGALGYAVADPASDAVRARTVLRDRTGGRAGPLLEALARDLGLQAPEVVVEPAQQAPQVVLEVGEDALGQIVTDAPTVDAEAPSSGVGVRVFGQWVPGEHAAAATDVPPARTPTATSTAKPLATATSAPSPARGTPQPTYTPAPPTPTPRPRPAVATATPKPRGTLTPLAPSPTPTTRPKRGNR